MNENINMDSLSYEESAISWTMRKYGCDQETAQRFLDLREEGYTMYQAKLMSGLGDPDE